MRWQAFVALCASLLLTACASSGAIQCRYTPDGGWQCVGDAQGAAQLPPVDTPAL